ncbi:MAG TPA: hypothetical protein VMV40_04355 [Acidiferrobacter sp.]|nr:hypothetical protein [Acidiferrobacter sp.]
MSYAKLLPVFALGFLVACARPAATSSSQPSEQKPKPVKSGYLTGKPRPGSKFYKVRIGMSRQEVMGLIGPPTSESTHPTGKQFIPFYYGGDEFRTDWYYRGEGELTFSQVSYGSSSEDLIYVRVNRKSSGYAK